MTVGKDWNGCKFALTAILLGAAFPAPAQIAAGSTKFIPTFLVYYGGGPALVAADAPKLAKFDLIDIDRFRYDNIGPNTWTAIKSINPGVQIYLYEVGPETPNHLDATPALYLNGLGRYDVSRGHFMGSLNGNHPELYLLDSAGKRVYSKAYSNAGANRYWHLMDFGAAAYQSYWLTAVKADIADQPWVADGVFVEDCMAHANAGEFSRTPTMYRSNAEWSGAMNSFVEAISGGLRGYGQKLWCNRGESGTADGSSAWLALDGGANPPEVLLEEGAFAVKSGTSSVKFHQESTWKRQVDTIGAIRNSRVAILSQANLEEGQAGTDNLGNPVTYGQALWYSLGSFLLSKNDDLGNAYFMFSGASGYDKIRWHAEYDSIDLGKAVGAYHVTSIGTVNVYWREFERGYVYVNPTPNGVAVVNLPQPSRQLTRDNMTSAPDSIPGVSVISLNGHHAAILLKAGTGPVSDTTAPSVPTGLVGSAVSSSQINLSWNPSTDNVGVTGYVVYLNDVRLADTTATSFAHTGLTAGTTYNYRVSAFDAAPNHSAWTAAPVAVTTPSLSDTQAPSVPTGLVGSAVSSSQINLSWNPSTDNVGVTGYYVYLNNVALAATSATSFQHTGLSAGATYNYRVSAFDAVPNHSAWTAAPVAVTTPPLSDIQAPSVPTGLVGTAVSSSQINLSWNPSTDNVGVTGYYVYLNDVALATTATTSFTHSGLTAGTTYNYRVSAFDAVPNHSAWTAAPVAVTTPPLPDTQAPGIPANLAASGVTASQVTLAWSAATDNVAVTGYRVYRDGALVASPAGTSVAVTGLSAATTYAFTASAVDAANNASAQSAPLSVTTSAAVPAPDTTAPSVPTGLVGTAVSSSQINLSWNASTDNVGVTGYVVYLDNVRFADTTTTSFTHSGLTAGTTYNYRVSAFDAVPNHSAWTATPVAVTTPGPAPTTTARRLFASGFEGATTIVPPLQSNFWGTGGWTDITGTDSTTGFTWPPNIWGGGGARFFFLTDPLVVSAADIGNYMFNRIEPVTGPRGNQTNVLRQQISQNWNGTGPMGTSPTTNLLSINPTGETSDLYISYWVKFQPDLVEKMATDFWGNQGTWRAFFAFKTGTQKPVTGPLNDPRDDGDYRLEVYVRTDNSAVPYWVIGGDNNAGGGAPTGVNNWRVENHTVPVPVGEWFKFEIFWHRSNGSDGRVWMAVNSQVIADRRGPNMGAWNLPINRISGPTVYTGGIMPAYQWIDDLEIWDGFPPSNGSNPPYAPH